MKIYVASSWRNKFQPDVVQALREWGHEVYDFRHPAPGNDGFAWSAIDRNWIDWTSTQMREGLNHPIAAAGFKLDFDAMERADVFVLVLPCGRSAHLEAGWAVGAGKKVVVYVPETGPRQEPELMYLMTSAIVVTMDELSGAIHILWKEKEGASFDLR